MAQLQEPVNKIKIIPKDLILTNLKETNTRLKNDNLHLSNRVEKNATEIINRKRMYFDRKRKQLALLKLQKRLSTCDEDISIFKNVISMPYHNQIYKKNEATLQNIQKNKQTIIEINEKIKEKNNALSKNKQKIAQRELETKDKIILLNVKEIISKVLKVSNTSNVEVAETDRAVKVTAVFTDIYMSVQNDQRMVADYIKHYAQSINVPVDPTKVGIPDCRITVSISKESGRFNLIGTPYEVSNSNHTIYQEDLGYGGQLFHPHWIEPNGPCLGSFAGALGECAHTFDFASIFEILRMYLSTFNLNDEAGYHSIFWEYNLSTGDKQLTSGQYHKICKSYGSWMDLMVHDKNYTPPRKKDKAYTLASYRRFVKLRRG